MARGSGPARLLVNAGNTGVLRRDPFGEGEEIRSRRRKKGDEIR